MAFLLRTEVYFCTPGEFERIPMRQRLADWTIYQHHRAARQRETAHRLGGAGS